MVNYSTQLVDYYYFIKTLPETTTGTGVIYKISLKNDSDECGKRLVIRDDETKEIDLAKNSRRFPNVKVEYSYTKNEKEVTDTKYYWFQSLIKDGDTYTEVGGFAPNTEHDTDGNGTKDSTYIAIVTDSIKNDIKTYVNNGYNLDKIKERIPYWCYCQQGDTVKIDNKTVTIKSINGKEGVLSEDFTDEAITNQIKDALKEKLLVIDNNYLDNFGLEVNASKFEFIEKSE